MISPSPRRLGRLVRLAACALAVWIGPGRAAVRAAAREVVLYCAQDEEFAEPLLKEFTRDTGIKVLPVFDSEAVKTVAIATRLLAEREHPQADVYWGNEELRARQLAAEGIFRATNGWAAFGQRTRRLAYNPKFVALTNAPRSLTELTNAVWRGRVSVAFPLFGTTSAHFLALRQHWGEAGWLTWCRALAANKPWIEEGNSQVAQRVGRGQAWIGLTDSDDVFNARHEGLSILPLPPSVELLRLPNTVGVIRGAPHPEAAEALFRFLQSPKVSAALVQAGALETATASGPGLAPDWTALLRDLRPATAQLEKVFRP